MRRTIPIAAALLMVAALTYLPRTLAGNQSGTARALGNHDFLPNASAYPAYARTQYAGGLLPVAFGVDGSGNIDDASVRGPRHSIAFHSDRDGNNEIYVMNPDGSDQTRLTSDPANDQRPDISPDGEYLVFSSTRNTDAETNPEGDFEIFLMKLDGSDVRQLTFNSAADSWPRWSPDGRWIAFHSNVDGNFEIYLIRPDGTDLTRVTNYSGIDQFPEWSPDGKQLVIRRDVDLYVIDVDGSNAIQLTAQAGLNQMASWSPDGKQLAFLSTRDGYPAIFVMNADGSDQVNLTPKPEGFSGTWINRAPGWWRNGQHIYFTGRRGMDTHENIYVMNADGTGAVSLTDDSLGNSAEGAVR